MSIKLSFDRPLLMGILNLTPDSFFDARTTVDQLIADGADIIDIGAESTFGYEAQVTAEEEWRRLEPILVSLHEERWNTLRREHLSERSEWRSKQSFAIAPRPTISIDTWKSAVAEQALKLGADMINDVTALRGDPEMIDVLLKYQPYVCLMYSTYDTPYAGRENKQYDDVIDTIKKFLKKQTDLLITRGFPKEKIIIDPGLGFFLSVDHAVSWEVIDRLDELKTLGFPILMGPSMKSFLGGEIANRLSKTLEASKKCLANGASILRVHDVGAHLNLGNLRSYQTTNPSGF